MNNKAMALTLGLVAVLMVSASTFASGAYAEAGLIGNGGSGQVKAKALYFLNQLILQLAKNNLIPPTLITIICRSVPCLSR